MTGAEMERAIAFVLQQQARFETQLTDLAERQNEAARLQKETDARIALLNEAVVGTVAAIHRLAMETEKRFAELTERVSTTSERLDAFIVIVERYITRNGNGNKPKS